MTHPASPERPIAVGDLVIMVRGHACALAKYGGIPFVVDALAPQRNGGWHCLSCNTGDIAPGDMFAAHGALHSKGSSGIPLSWLLRIDPPALSESTGEPAKEVA